MLTNAGFVAMSQVVAKATTLVWTVVAAQMLGRESFGSFNFALATALVLATFVEWGFNSLLVQRSSVDKPSLSRHYAETLAWQGAIATILLIVSVAGYAIYKPDASLVLSFALIQVAVICDTASSASRAAASVLQRQVKTSLALVVQRVVGAGVIVLALLGSASLLALSAAFAVGSVIGLVLHLVVLHRMGVRLSPTFLTRSGLLAFGAGTSRIGVSVLLGSLLFRVGFILLGIFWGDTEVGVYAAAFKLFDTVLFLSYALVAAAFPSMSEAAGGARHQLLTEGAFGLLAVVYVPYAVVSVVLAPELIAFVFGPDYVADSTVALRILALAPLLFGFTYVGGTALVAATHTQGVMVSSAAAAAVAVGVGLALAPTMGAGGAAGSLVIALVVEAVVIAWYLREVYGSWPRLFPQLVQPLIASAAIVPLVVLTHWPVFVELGLAAALYVGLWLALSRRWPPSSLAVIGRTSRQTGDSDESGALPDAADAHLELA